MFRGLCRQQPCSLEYASNMVTATLQVACVWDRMCADAVATRCTSTLLMLVVQVGAYSAEQSAQERSQVQEAFNTGALKVLVATSAFGLGVNKPNIRWVWHLTWQASMGPGQHHSIVQHRRHSFTYARQLCIASFQPVWLCCLRCESVNSGRGTCLHARVFVPLQRHAAVHARAIDLRGT